MSYFIAGNWQVQLLFYLYKQETEESRNQSLQKRLDEEQVKLDAKRAKKNRPKLLL